jgi:signal transduction histidine kinase
MTSPRVLIVHDKALLAELSDRVSRMGMTVVGATASGEEAIALAGTHSPDLVLMDIGLRGRVDGIAAASTIRARHNMSVVFITADSDPSTIERAKEAAPLGILIQPFSDRDLQSAIEMALHKRATDWMTDRQMEADRLQSLGRLAEGVARDLGQLLEPILGNVRLAAEHVPPGSKLDQQLDSINAAAERAAELCRQMRQYAGASAVTMTRTRLDQVVAEIEHLLRVAVARRSTLALEWESDGIEVDVDRGQVQQIVMHLALNAAEAVGESGAIVIRTQRVELSSGDVDDLPEGLYAVIDVQDNGAGMDDKTAAHVFEPFATTTTIGRGLGLASAQGIARAHRGVITVTSAPDEGTTFRVYLPAAG